MNSKKRINYKGLAKTDDRLLDTPCNKCGANATPIKTMADSIELFCLNCREVVDDRPALHPVIRPRLGQSEAQRPRQYIPDPRLFNKTTIPRSQKDKQFCEEICTFDEDDQIRQEYEIMYCSRILSSREYELLKTCKWDKKSKSKVLMSLFKTDEEYERYLKQIERINARKTNLKVQTVPRIIPSSTDYKHCSHCETNIEVATYIPLPLPKEQREKKEQEHQEPFAKYREFEFEGEWMRETVSRTEEGGRCVTIDIITKQMEERKKAELKASMLEEQRQRHKIMFSSRMSPLLDGKYRKPTKADEKMVKKMATYSKNDPKNKDNPYNKLLDRYERGKIGYNKCLCCNQRLKPGLVDYRNRDSY